VQVILSPPLSVGPSPSAMSSSKKQANCTVMGRDIAGSLKLCIVCLCLCVTTRLRFFRAFSSVVRQMPG
jgi:hypothetical protein